MPIMDFETILLHAHEDAALAQKGATEGGGLDCGFAWVVVDGNSPLARFCRAQLKKEEGALNPKPYGYYGRKEYPKGWCFWEPGGWKGQSVSVHELGAQAFRDYLASHGIRATALSRLD